ncbi:MAG: hypothetical protein ACLUD2_03470 [Clostridium sp.]
MRQLVDPLFQQAGYKPQILIETAMNHALIQLSKGFFATHSSVFPSAEQPLTALTVHGLSSVVAPGGSASPRRKDTSLSEANTAISSAWPQTCLRSEPAQAGYYLNDPNENMLLARTQFPVIK